MDLEGLMEQIAREVSERLGLTEITSPISGSQEEIDFTEEIIWRIAQTNGNQEQIHQFFREHVDRLDWTLLSILPKTFDQLITSQQLGSPQSLASVFGIFGQLIQQFPLGNRKLNLEMAIKAYELALQVYTRNAFPQDWANTQYHLATAYAERIKDDPSVNLEWAIKLYQEILQVYTQDSCLQSWIMTQNKLAVAYANRVQGDRSKNIERAIKLYKQILEACDAEVPLELKAEIQNNLATVYINRIEEDPETNLEEAIGYYQQALQIYTRAAFPQFWADIQKNLANAYRKRVQGGGQGRNIERAILACNLALEIYTPNTFPEQWASAQHTLALAYAARKVGNRMANLETAIQHSENALQVYTHNAFPQDWARAQYDLVIAYTQYAGTQWFEEDKKKSLEKAITAYEQALHVPIHNLSLQDWTHTQYHLANTYAERLQGVKEENLEKAINIYDQVLRVYTFDQYPVQWANTQHKLAHVYYNRIRGDRAKNLEAAILGFEQALKVRTEGEFQWDWANSQFNLALAYDERIEGNKADNLAKVVEIYTQALRVYTPSESAFNWGAIQHNLACAYSHQSFRGNRAENLEQAIKLYKQALEVTNPNQDPLGWALTQNNLAVTYHDRIRGERAENLEQAIQYYKQALTVRTRDLYPLDWAQTQRNLAIAYCDRKRGERAENLEQAIRGYQEVLEVYTRDKFPQHWAITQRNLANAYDERLYGDPSENLEKAQKARNLAKQIYTQNGYPLDWAAIECEKAAAEAKRAQTKHKLGQAISQWESHLEIYTPETDPIGCYKLGKNLGGIAFSAGQWTDAMRGYETAIEAIEHLRSSFLRESRRQEIINDSIGIYQNMIQACIYAGELELALQTVERIRSKRLVDLMGNSHIPSNTAISPTVQALLESLKKLERSIQYWQAVRDILKNQQEALKELQNSLKKGQNPQQDTLNKILKNLKRLEKQEQDLNAQIQNLLEKLQKAQPDIQPFINPVKSVLDEIPEILKILEKKQRGLNARTQNLVNEYKNKRDTLSLSDPVSASLLKVTPLDIATIQHTLLQNQPKTACLSFYTTSFHTHIFILRRNKLELFTCEGQGTQQLENWLWQKWVKPYSENRQSWQNEMPNHLQTLSQDLKLDDLITEHLSDVTHLILIPHRYLHIIPFAALPTSKGYLGDVFTLSYAPSCQVLKFCSDRDPLSLPPTYGIVEDATEDLPFAKIHGNWIANCFNIPEDKRLRGSQATPLAYRALLNQVQSLVSYHHAQARLDNPLASGLNLSNGTLTLAQLLSPSWRFPNLSDVFLSCCETALAKPTDLTDEIPTLGTGFLCAGARTVISSLWTVYAIPTALFSRFYHEYRTPQGENCDRTLALQKAQQQLRMLTGEQLQEIYQKEIIPALDLELARLKQTNQKDLAKKLEDDSRWLEKLCQNSYPFEHPFYWAAFKCEGLP